MENSPEDTKHKEMKEATVFMLKRHPMIPVVNLIISHTRAQCENRKEDWGKLDFLEEFVLSKLSVRAEAINQGNRSKEQRDQLPKVRLPKFKSREDQDEFRNRWRKFLSSDRYNQKTVDRQLNSLYKFMIDHEGRITKAEELSGFPTQKLLINPESPSPDTLEMPAREGI